MQTIGSNSQCQANLFAALNQQQRLVDGQNAKPPTTQTAQMQAFQQLRDQQAKTDSATLCEGLSHQLMNPVDHYTPSGH